MSNQLTLKDFKHKKLNSNSTPLEMLAFVAEVALQELKGKQIVEANSSTEENAEANPSRENGKPLRNKKRKSPPIKNNSKRKINDLEIPNEEWIKQFTDKKKRKDNSNAPRPLPEEFETQIIKKCSGSRPNRIIRIFQKNLFETDVSKNHNRLMVSLNKMESFEFLKDEEITLLRQGKAIEVPLIHKPIENDEVPLPLTETIMTFRQWDLHKGEDNTQKISYQYVLNGSWRKIVDEGNLKKGDTVDVWAFRDIENKLCMVVTKRE